MAKKRKAANDPTAISRVKAHRQRMTSAGWKQVAIWLPPEAIAELERLCTDRKSTRQDVITQLITETVTSNDPPAVTPETVTSNGTPAKPKRKPPAKKSAAAAEAPKRKTKHQTKSTPPAKTTDAIGLSRPDGFKDFARAVAMIASVKDAARYSKDGRQWLEWQDVGNRETVSVRDAQKRIEAFRQDHSDAEITERLLGDHAAIELLATYPDDRPDHKIVCHARNRIGNIQ